MNGGLGWDSVGPKGNMLIQRATRAVEENLDRDSRDGCGGRCCNASFNTYCEMLSAASGPMKVL